MLNRMVNTKCSKWLGPWFCRPLLLSTRSQTPLSLFVFLTSVICVHAPLTYAAVASCGIDRHLLGLGCILDSEWDWLNSSVEEGNENRLVTRKYLSAHRHRQTVADSLLYSSSIPSSGKPDVTAKYKRSK
ncbi:hypothetical protein SCLCIDRAFT_1106424 [Scleroderma citrinum Foug A]|uniref:Uncharacterized protein n=1 Tax=Scleroderma citrinum Foug A TaxID=1036808 RepID=A0A0C3A1H0_9AGAM|nr:hypothetical protein SCLCIDRAFT_1106424 [Scleroderma citrinum Foug A]